MAPLAGVLLAAAYMAAWPSVAINWDPAAAVATNSTPTYQTSVNPKYRMDGLEGTSNISRVVFDNMKLLGADYMRHVPWFPYPRLAVAELYAPVRNLSCTSSWDFTYIDPITNALMKATAGHPIVAGFATTPDWMWAPGKPNMLGVNARDGAYDNGTRLLDTTFGQIIGYYTRLAQYYTAGGFTDECGVFHKGYHYEFAWWEVFNEPASEHGLSIQYYDQLYDALVAALMPIMPRTKFLGLAKGTHGQYDWYSYHLNRSNHHPQDIPLDGISYHMYVLGSGTVDEMAASFFAQMDTFVAEVQQIEAIKQSFDGERVETFINEIGCGTQNYTVPMFYNLCAATYAYLFAKAAPLKVQHFGMSQVIGFTGPSLCPTCPDEWPSTSMVDWYTGKPNARFWVLKMMIDHLPTGQKATHPTVSALANVTAQAFTLSSTNERKLLLVSTKNQELQVDIGAPYTAVFVDNTTGDQFSCQHRCVGTVERTENAFVLRAFSVAILTLV
ncbi:Beta-galactosidase 8 [Diplonema papillatum]|nr:Beta-galactosidase 8 [Diplonema papillatum]|eukprot:gene12448-19249_t